MKLAALRSTVSSQSSIPWCLPRKYSCPVKSRLGRLPPQLVLRIKPIRREDDRDTRFPLARLDPHNSSFAQNAKRYLRTAPFQRQDRTDGRAEGRSVLRLVKHPG